MNKRTIIPFIDVLFSFLLVFICIVMLVKTKQEETALQQQVVYQIILEWHGSLNSDVDLWVKDPEGRVVGFNRREGGDGSLFSLNRDDLGSRTEQQDGKIIPVNEEIVALRGVFNGEYTVNGHLYLRADNPPVLATVKLVKVKPYKEIIKTEKTFNESGDEETFFRFKIQDGNVLETNELPQKIATVNKTES